MTNVGKGEDVFDPAEYLEQKLNRKLNIELLTANRRRREMEKLESQLAMPGVEGYLRNGRAMGLKIGLASCSSHGWVVDHLERLKILEFFDYILTREDVINLKPDPELYIRALERLVVNPQETVAFEDSPYGVLAAKGVGLHCVVVPNPLSRMEKFDQADMTLDSLEEVSLEQLLSRI